MDSTFVSRLSLTLLARKEEYTLTIPDFHVKGLLVGTMVTEFGGPCSVKCKKTGFR